jgi:hypothetical protein
MSVAADTIDKKINNYLGVLSTRQKKALLTIAKTFAEEQTSDIYSDKLKAELDGRYEDYKKGKPLVSEEEANKRIRNVIKQKDRK